MGDILQKDSLFFENLFREYYKSLKAYAFKFVNDLDVAEDIVQDVFFELWLKRYDINIKQQLRPYLFKAVSNKSINYLKSKRDKISLEAINNNDQLEFYLHTLATEEDYLLLDELNNEIKACVDQLPDQCKRIFILHHTYNLKNREIAEQLNISLKAVEKQISKALLRIRTHLTKLDLLPFWVSIIISKMID